MAVKISHKIQIDSADNKGVLKLDQDSDFYNEPAYNHLYITAPNDGIVIDVDDIPHLVTYLTQFHNARRRKSEHI